MAEHVGRRRTRSFLEEDAEAEENIRQLAAAAAMHGATSRKNSGGNGSGGGSDGGRGRGRSTSFHVGDEDSNSNTTTDESSSGSDSDSSGNSGSSSGSSSNNSSGGSSSSSSSSSSSGRKKSGRKKNRQVSKKTQRILDCEQLKEETKKQPMSAADKAEQKLREDRKLQGSGGGGSGKRVPRTSPSNNGRRGGGRNKKSKAQQQPYDQLVKILLLGDSGVGKTCLLTRFAEKKYSPSLVTTAGIDFKVQYFEVNGVKIKCQIWDTAGQERFHVITKAYYKGAHGIALVYDTTDRKTLDNIDYWLGNISDNAQDEVEQVLIANKVDLPRVINEEEGIKVAEARGIRYLETSAKTGTNVRAGKISLIYWLNFSILCSSQSLTFPLFLFLYLLFFLFCHSIL